VTKAAASAANAVASARIVMLVSHTAAIAPKLTEMADMATGVSRSAVAQRATSRATGSEPGPAARWFAASSSAAIPILPAYPVRLLSAY